MGHPGRNCLRTSQPDSHLRLAARSTPQIMVYNKIDKLEGWILVADGWGVLKKL